MSAQLIAADNLLPCGEEDEVYTRIYHCNMQLEILLFNNVP